MPAEEPGHVQHHRLGGWRESPQPRAAASGRPTDDHGPRDAEKGKETDCPPEPAERGAVLLDCRLMRCERDL